MPRLEKAMALYPKMVRRALTFDRDYIRESLKAGSNLTFARLLPRGSSLRIR